MTRMKWFVAGLMSTAALISSAVLLSQNQTPPAFKSEEYLLLGDATRGAGEPMIAVDPTNPKNIIAVAMGTLTTLPPPPPGMNRGQASVPRSTITWLAVTHDGGITWKVGELPILSGTYTRCPDPFADVTKYGQFLAGCEPRETIGSGYGMSAVMASDDRGDTWSKPADIVSSSPARFAPGLKPYIQGASPYDRPFTYIDDSTNVVYGIARGGQAVGEKGPRRQSYITASTDGGKSFGTVYPWDSPDYPQLSNGVGATAGLGTVAVVYTAGKAPASANAVCPCVVFGLSKDMGKTFTYRVLKNIPPNLPDPQPGQRGGGAAAGSTTTLLNVSADQTKAGRYALLTYVSGLAPEYRVLVTEDYGQTWSAPTSAGKTPGARNFVKPAFEYSRDGILGLMWRAIYPDNTYDIWSTISRDGGKTFSAPLRVSHEKSPAPSVRAAGNDDIQDLSMDKEGIHLVWGDYRSGFMATWYGHVPFSAY